MYMTCMLQVDLSEHQQSKWGPDISNTTIVAGHVEVFRLYIYTSHCTLQAKTTHPPTLDNIFMNLLQKPFTVQLQPKVQAVSS